MIYRKNSLIIVICIMLLTPGQIFAGEKASINWEKCLVMTRYNNPVLVSARMEVRKAQAATGIAWSEVLPEASVYARSGFGASNGTLGASHSYGITANQELFKTLQSVHNIKASKLRAHAAAYNYRVISSEVHLNLRLAYLELMKYQEEVKLFSAIAARRRDNYNLVAFRYKSGREHLGSMLMAKANLSEANFEVSEVKRNIAIAKKGLMNAIGKSASIDTISVDYDMISDVNLAKQPSFNTLMESSPLLKQMLYLTRAGVEELEASYLSFYPRIALSASAGKSGHNFPPTEDDWSVGLTVTYPLFNQVAHYYTTKRYKAELQDLKAREQDTKNSLLYALEYRWISMLNIAAKLKVFQDNLRAAEERARIARAQYPIGIIDFNSWSLIENALVTARKNLLEAKIFLLTAEAYWIKAYGGTLEYTNAE